MKQLFLLLFVALSVGVQAAPFHGEIRAFKQPDGSWVDLKLFGHEYYMRAEGLDGYTLIRDEQSKWICYARLSADGHALLSSGIAYKGKKDDKSTLRHDLGFPKHLDISQQALQAKMRENMHRLGENEEHNIFTSPGQNDRGTPVVEVKGNIKGLCIVVDFSDEPGNLPMSEFEEFCNDLNYKKNGNNGSLRTYFSSVSGGLVDYENVVYGYYRAPKTFAEYDAMPYAQGAREILGLALKWIKDQGFDFSTLSINPDNSIRAINLMYTGTPPAWAEGMWHHKGYYGEFSANGVHTGDYNCSPANNPLTLAVVAHENGHMIGKWPDTYKYSGDTGPDGIGSFDLMCWYGSYTNPVPPNPLFRSNAGWGKVVDITDFNGINSDTANSMTCYKYVNHNNPDEFFLLENRLKKDRSEAIEDEGLTIWHIDRSGNNQSTHHEVYLVHANDNVNNHSGACFHIDNAVEYGETSTPNSNFYDGTPSGLRVWDFSATGQVMTYRLGTGEIGPLLRLNYVSTSGDDNNNGFIEPAESANIHLKAANKGQLPTGETTLSCEAVGPNAGYVTINTASLQLGILDLNQSIDTLFNFSLQAETPLGTELEFRFQLSDLEDTVYVTRKLIVGVLINMNFAQNTTCSAVFFDPGGPNADYDDNLTYFKTIIPSSPDQKVQLEFQSFDLEESENCQYDYLTIYDGPSASDPLIGTFCGSNSPGTISSTHPSGSLRLIFHSDEGAAASGWKAIISCLTVSSTDNPAAAQFAIYPNPSEGLFTIVSESTQDLVLSVSDIYGKKLLSRNVQAKGSSALDLSAQPNGVYLVQGKVNNQVFVQKVVIQK